MARLAARPPAWCLQAAVTPQVPPGHYSLLACEPRNEWPTSWTAKRGTKRSIRRGVTEKGILYMEGIVPACRGARPGGRILVAAGHLAVAMARTAAPTGPTDGLFYPTGWEHREAFRRAGRGGGPPGDRFAPDCVGSSLDQSRACFPGPPAQWLRCSLAAAVKQRLQPLAGSNLQRRRRATAGSGGGEGGSPCRAPAAPASRQEEPERQRMRWRREEVCARCWGVVAAGDGVRVSGARRWIPGIAVG